MTNPPRVLVVEDDKDLAELVRYNLQKSGYSPDACADGRTALSLLKSNSYALILLDLMIPELSGVEVARRVRADPALARIPIIMVTAKVGEADQIAGLGIADDYITKPFSFRILLARVEALLRRSSQPAESASPPETVRIASVEVDLSTHRVTVAGTEQKFTLTEFKLLIALMQARGRVLSRQDLITRVMGSGVVVTSRTIDVHIASIRRKLEHEGDRVRTVRGVGYLFNADAHVPAQESAVEG